MSTEKPSEQVNSRDRDYLTGWRLHIITAALCVIMCVAQMESTVTSTAVITITNDLGGFIKSSWMLTAYWLTSGAFQIIWAKISDIYGRKLSILISLFLFTAFSGACGGSQTIIQLIMFRWLQGIGGCGILALSQLVFVELIPPEKYPKYIGIVSAAMTAPLVLGPLVGGGISSSGDWRWIFLLNVPIGVIIMAIVAAFFPRRLKKEPRNKSGPVSVKSLRKIDFIGCTLLLGTCLLLTTGLQQAARGYSFSSAFVLPLLICSAPFFVLFLLSQRYITKRESPEPVFPWRFFQSRVRAAVVLITLLNGGVLSICVVQIPQRFITVNGASPFTAAAKLLAFGAFVIFGSVVAVPVMDRLRVPPALVMVTGGCLEVIGTAVLSQASSDFKIKASQYGCQVLIGSGVGFIVSAVMMLIKSSFEERDMAVATAAQSQFRTLGGLIGVSIGTTITNRSIQPQIRSILPPQLAAMILERTEVLNVLSKDVLAQIRVIFAKSYNKQMYLASGLAAACIMTALMAWSNPRKSATSQDSPVSKKSIELDTSGSNPSTKTNEVDRRTSKSEENVEV